MLFAAVKPVRMNPACAMLEYASRRLTSRWAMASTDPTTIDTTASA